MNLGFLNRKGGNSGTEGTQVLQKNAPTVLAGNASSQTKQAIFFPRQKSGERMPLAFSKSYPLVGRIATTYAESDAVALIFDQTGSMEKDPKVFIRELPDLMSHAEGLGRYSRLYEVAFGAIGDARNNEQYPVQLCGFTSNIVLAKKSLESLYLEGLGGSNGGESYDLGIYGLASRIDLAHGQKGFAVILGDEPYFRDIRPKDVQKYFGENAKFATISESVAALRQKGIDVYALLRDSSVTSVWANLLGSGFVAMLDSPEKVVQAIVGIMAARVGRKNEFIGCLSSGKNSAISGSVAKALGELEITPKALIGN